MLSEFAWLVIEFNPLPPFFRDYPVEPLGIIDDISPILVLFDEFMFSALIGIRFCILLFDCIFFND